MRNRIVLIRPFFQGHFPSFFQLFLNSCRDNPDFDWMIFTDNEEPYDYPQNVHKIRMTFAEARELFQSRFDFPISIPEPYKLCDYKAAFGYVFSDYIRKYDFWGHNDYDVIYGDLGRFVTDEMLDSYDKMFAMGHFTLYKNTAQISALFMKEIQGRLLYKEVMTSDINCNFDEDWNGILNVNDIFRENGARLYENPKNESMVADIYDKSTFFRVAYWDRHAHKTVIEPKKNAFFAHVNGRLVRYEKDGNKIRETEYMYIHLIHRRMKMGDGVLQAGNFTIIPDSFMPLNTEVSSAVFDSVCRRKVLDSCLNYFKLRWGNLKIKAGRIKKK